MSTFAIQYLEDNPELNTLSPEEVRTKFREACQRLPISYLLLGWHLPESLLQVCVEEAAQAGVPLFRWHPLLTGDGVFRPRPEWQTIGLKGDPVPGFKNMLEFTFVCPNRPALHEAVLDHLQDTIRLGRYQGLFLDRMRFPSPAADPAAFLACFCEDCQRVAFSQGFDLEAARRQIQSLLNAPETAPGVIQMLLDPQVPLPAGPGRPALKRFLDFRVQTITHFIGAVAELAYGAGLGVGLDCFSPALTYMVGQELITLKEHCDWIKIMSYAHTLGPAGLPFELLGLANWLVEAQGLAEAEALQQLALATHLPLPSSGAALRHTGLKPEALAIETRRGRAAGIDQLLVGIELVEIEGVTRLRPEQTEADLQAIRAAGAPGLVLSWDLWHIPLERLELVRKVWSD